MDNLLKDLRYSFRQLLHFPAFAAVAILSLALGIGANSAIFSVVNTLFTSPVAVAEPQTIVSIFTKDEKNPGDLPVSYLNFVDFREKNDVFSHIFTYTFTSMSLTRNNSEPDTVIGGIVSGDYFDALGVKPVIGRGFSPEEDKTPNTHPVAVISYGMWQRNFGGNSNLLGQTIQLNRHDFTVIGVAP